MKSLIIYFLLWVFVTTMVFVAINYLGISRWFMGVPTVGGLLFLLYKGRD